MLCKLELANKGQDGEMEGTNEFIDLSQGGSVLLLPLGFYHAKTTESESERAREREEDGGKDKTESAKDKEGQKKAVEKLT